MDNDEKTGGQKEADEKVADAKVNQAAENLDAAKEGQEEVKEENENS